MYIKGPAGQLEIALEIPPNHDNKNFVVVCHPHPLFEGTMQNKVVTTIAKAFCEKNIASIRFNFRGVGQSQGVYDSGIGEAEDLAAVVNYIKTTYPEANIHLAGFSFGSYIATKMAHTLNAKSLIAIAPPVNHFNFSDFTLPTCPWLIIQGTGDDVVPAPEVLHWVDTLNPKPQLAVLEGAGHFFHGRLMELKQLVMDFT